MQAAVDGPTLDALASAEAARGCERAMPPLKGEGIGASQPGEPLRGVGGERKNAFVRIDDLIAAIGGEGNHGNGARGWARAGRGIRDGRKSRHGGRRGTGCWGRKQGRWTWGRELEKCQRKARDLLLQREDLELHLSEKRVDIGGRQRGRRSRGSKGGRQRTTVSCSQVLDLGEGETFLTGVFGMRQSRQSSLVQPETQGFGIDTEKSANMRQGKKIHSEDPPFKKADQRAVREPQQMSIRDSQGNARQSQGISWFFCHE
jgi:hypothetical protein